MPRRPLTLAKVSRPRLHDVVARERLHALLDAAAARPVVWLSAQPGAGKTTLVAAHLEARRRPGIWYQVDAADADAASFVYHLRLAAGAGDDSAEPLPRLTPEYRGDLAGFGRRFFRALFAALPPDAALVLDQLQDVPPDADVHRLLAEGLAQVPPGVTVFVMSLADPPPPYASLLAGGAIELLDNLPLQLTLDETREIAARRGVTDDAAVKTLHERAHGWAAGLTLLLARTRGRADQPADDDDAESLQHVFDYFAARVFDGMAAPHRDALLRLAWLPQIALPMAQALTGLDEASRLLERLYRRHLFTDRRRIAADGRVEPVYQFHGLFRRFLMHRAQAEWGAAGTREVCARAGRLLAEAGAAEQALDLLAQAGEWGGYARTLAARAEALLDQGRHDTVRDALARLPEAERAREPWLGYWGGRALMQAAPEAALRTLDAAMARFAECGDGAGQLACGAAAVQTLWYARLGWSEITPRVDRLEPLIAVQAGFPTPAVELLSLSALHAALAFCRPAHAAISPLALRLLDLVDDEAIDWNARLAAATHLITYLHNAAEGALAARLVARVDAGVESRPGSTLNRAFWYVFRAMHDLRQGDHARAAGRFERAEALARDDGLLHAEFAALQFHTYLDVMFRRAGDAQARLRRLEQHPARAHPDGALNLAVAQTLYAQLRGDAAGALAHAERGLAAVAQVGAAYFDAVFPVLFASALADAGQAPRALAILARSRELSRGGYLEAMDAQLWLEEAYVRLQAGEAEAARACLAEGLATAARNPSRAGYVHRIVARKPVLLERALAEGLEPEFAAELVRRWQIPPPPHAPAAWPWPVRILTLGRFELQVHDAPVSFGRKAPRKTLALLKAVVARGGSAPDTSLIDTFWPDEDGDAAARSLGAAVLRLRALIGEPDVLVQQGGQLRLDRTRVWVDAWAFEHALSQPAHAGVDTALALYRGPFLADDEGETWPVAARERLRARFVAAVSDEAARLEAARRFDQALALYGRGLDADPVVEPFYQGLMRCYHGLDRRPEALAAYRRLRQTLSIVLGLAPSAATERLVRTLQLG